MELPRDTPAGAPPPSAFGRFRVVHQVGAGVLGPVFRGFDPEHDRAVAIKAFSLDLTPEQARDLAADLDRLPSLSLKHPSIIVPYAAGADGSTAYLVQEYFVAESADVALKQYGPAPVPDAMRLIGQLAGALDFAAAAGVHHGALHPRDILVAPHEVRLSGLGVVEALERVGYHPPARRPYAAPERIAAAPCANPADVYSLACVSHELLTGRRPSLSGETATVEPDAIPSAAPAALSEVFARGLSPRPEDRFGSALAFAAALKHALTGEPLVAGEGVAERPRARRAARVGKKTPPAAQAASAGAAEAASEPPADDTAPIPAVVESETLELPLAPPEPPPATQPVVEPPPPDPTPLPSFLEEFQADPPAAPPEASTSRATMADEPPPPFEMAEPSLHPGEPPLDVVEPLATPEPDLNLVQPESAIDDLDRRVEATVEVRPVRQKERRVSEPDLGGLPPPGPATLGEPAVVPPAEARARAGLVPMIGMLIVGFLLGLPFWYFMAPREAAAPAAPAASQPAVPAPEQPAPSQASPAASPADVVPTLPPPSSPTATSSAPGEDSARGVGAAAATKPSAPPAARTAKPSPRPAPPRAAASTRGTAAAAQSPAGRKPATPRAAFEGSLVIASKPGGANVLLDGRPVGTTPLTMQALTAGSHVVRLELAGYQIWSSSVQVTAGKVNRVTASLERRPGG